MNLAFFFSRNQLILSSGSTGSSACRKPARCRIYSRWLSIEKSRIMLRLLARSASSADNSLTVADAPAETLGVLDLAERAPYSLVGAPSLSFSLAPVPFPTLKSENPQFACYRALIAAFADTEPVYPGSLTSPGLSTSISGNFFLFIRSLLCFISILLFNYKIILYLNN